MPIPLLMLILLVPSLAASAASQGQLGRTSTGSIRITLVIPPNLNATTSTSATISKHKQKQLCVSGQGIHHYSLTAQGNRSDENLILISRKPDSASLKFSILAESQSLQMRYNPIQKRYQTQTQAQDCLKPVDINVQLTPSQKQALSSGNYTGSATVTISAE